MFRALTFVDQLANHLDIGRPGYVAIAHCLFIPAPVLVFLLPARWGWIRLGGIRLTSFPALWRELTLDPHDYIKTIDA